MTTTLDRSKQMNLLHEDLARAHRRWRGNAAPAPRLARGTERSLGARRELARLLYGAAGR